MMFTYELDQVFTKQVAKPAAHVPAERIAKLPKWAQAHIADLQQQAVAAAEGRLELTYDKQQAKAIDRGVWCVEGSVIGPAWK